MPGKDQQERNKGPSPLAYASVGFEVVVPVVLFLFAGYKLDGWLGSQPWFFLLGALLGIAVGLYGLFRRLLPKSNDGGRTGP